VRTSNLMSVVSEGIARGVPRRREREERERERKREKKEKSENVAIMDNEKY